LFIVHCSLLISRKKRANRQPSTVNVRPPSGIRNSQFGIRNSFGTVNRLRDNAIRRRSCGPRRGLSSALFSAFLHQLRIVPSELFSELFRNPSAFLREPTVVSPELFGSIVSPKLQIPNLPAMP
jgi:hypothetical protein